MSNPNFIVTGEFTIIKDGKILDYKVEYKTDGTIKQENGEAWLKLISRQEEQNIRSVVEIR